MIKYCRGINFFFLKLHLSTEVFSTTKYFAMLAVIAIVPLIYVSSLGISCFPTEGYKPLKDQIVAEFLNINLSTETVQIINSCNKVSIFLSRAQSHKLAKRICLRKTTEIYKKFWTKNRSISISSFTTKISWLRNFVSR